MAIVIFDTETTSLEKPFCYNIGYVIYDETTDSILVKRDFVCEQVWHNPMLFTTAYYSNKRPIYVERMRKRETILDKFGYICQQMIRDFKAFSVNYAFAYNSAFDEKVFDFNCDWFKCNNPFDAVEIKDVRAFAHKYIVDDDYIEFCEEHHFFTETGNYSTTAETMFRYVNANLNFEEEHTALADSIIECDILIECLKRGAELNEELVAKRSIPRVTEKVFVVKKNGQVVFEDNCTNAVFKKTVNTVYLK